jgi:hypothetical protein
MNRLLQTRADEGMVNAVIFLNKERNRGKS